MKAKEGLSGVFNSALYRVSDVVRKYGAIRSTSPRAKRFGRFGDGSIIAWPVTTLYNENYVWLGENCWVADHFALGVGIAPGQEMLTNPVVSIGDRCLIGRASGIVGHYRIEIGDDVWTGHHVYITDQNHGYEDLDLPIGRQSMPEKAVSIGNGSWLGHGSIVLPGASIGEHCVIAAGSVVTKDVPSFSVVAGVPARVIRRYEPGQGWHVPHTHRPEGVE